MLNTCIAFLHQKSPRWFCRRMTGLTWHFPVSHREQPRKKNPNPLGLLLTPRRHTAPTPFPNRDCTLPPALQDKKQVSCKSGVKTSLKIKKKKNKNYGGLTFLLGLCREKKKKGMQVELQLQLPIALEAAFAPPPSHADGGKRRCGKARRRLDPSHGTAGRVRRHGRRAARLPGRRRGFGSEPCKAGRPLSPGCEVAKG